MRVAAHRTSLLIAFLLINAATACGTDPIASIDPIGTTAPIPLLERPTEQLWECVPTTVDYGVLGDAFTGGASITATNEGFLLALCEAGWATPTAGVQLVPIGSDGSKGAAIDLEVEASSTVDCQVAARGDGAAVSWREFGATSETVRWSAVDSQGVKSGEPSTIISNASYSFRLEQLIDLGGAGDATGVLWVDSQGLHFQLVSDAGVPQGSPTLLATGYPSEPRGVRTADGFLFTWTQGWPQDGEVYALATDPSGNPLGPVSRIARPTTETLTTQNGDLVALPDGSVLAAVSERVKRGEEPESPDMWVDGPWPVWPDGSWESTLLLQRLDTSGASVGPLERMQTGEPHMENVYPSLAVIGDDVAVSWSKGRVIYICGGCIRDNSLQLVRLSATDLSRTSAVVEVPPDGVNGLFLPRLAASGNTLAVTFAQDFHASSKAGWAHIGCQAQ